MRHTAKAIIIQTCHRFRFDLQNMFSVGYIMQVFIRVYCISIV